MTMIDPHWLIPALYLAAWCALGPVLDAVTGGRR